MSSQAEEDLEPMSLISCTCNLNISYLEGKVLHSIKCFQVTTAVILSFHVKVWAEH